MGGELRFVFLDSGEETVLEDGLRDGDEECTAQGLEEGYAGGGYRDVGEGENGLHYDDATLETDAYAGAAEDLVAEPLAEGGCYGEGRDEAGADREEDHAEEHYGDVESDCCDQASGHYRGYHGADEKGEKLDSCFGCRGAFHGLEVDCEVKDDGEESGAEEERECECKRHIPVLEEPWWKGAFVTESDLRVDEDDD